MKKITLYKKEVKLHSERLVITSGCNCWNVIVNSTPIIMPCRLVHHSLTTAVRTLTKLLHDSELMEDRVKRDCTIVKWLITGLAYTVKIF